MNKISPKYYIGRVRILNNMDCQSRIRLKNCIKQFNKENLGDNITLHVVRKRDEVVDILDVVSDCPYDKAVARLGLVFGQTLYYEDTE